MLAFTWLFCMVVITACLHSERKEDQRFLHAIPPYTVAVLPARLQPPEDTENSLEVQPGTPDETFLTELVRGVIQNQLAGKGYACQVLPLVDRKVSTLGDWTSITPKDLCRQLQVDGVVVIDIRTARILKAGIYDEYSLDSGVRIIDKAGSPVVDVAETESKRSLSIPTTPLGGVVKLIQLLVDSSARQHMRMVVYAWGWKVAQTIPDNVQGESLPEVLMVSTNIDKGSFAVGDSIDVELNTEKNLTCTFDLGDFRKGIPLSSDGAGVYRGSYVVREGDWTTGQPLQIRMERPNGMKRIWVETGGTIAIDAVPPPPPERLNSSTSVVGVSLLWSVPREEDLISFLVERSESPVAKFVTIASSEKATFVDPDVSQGGAYYYRIRSRDRLGNVSKPSNVLEVIVPQFGETVLPEPLKETLVPGAYKVERDLVVPNGVVFRPGAGVTLLFSPDAGLIVDGRLEMKGTEENPILLEGLNGGPWKGIQVGRSGHADIEHARLRGCSTCVEVSGGKGTLTRSTLEGNGGTGVMLQKNLFFGLQEVRITDFETGILVERGEGSIDGCTLTHNTVGLQFIRGALRIMNSNFYENRTNVNASEPVVLEGCYLGAGNSGSGELPSGVLVRELLDAPYPQGRKISVSQPDQEVPVSPVQTEQRYEEHKAAGLAAFERGDFQSARDSLNIALTLKSDKEVFKTLAYAQIYLKEPDKAGETLQKGIEAFPEDPELYPIYVQYLVSRGDKGKAIPFLQKGLALNPNDENLKFLEKYVEERKGQ